ncbi:hypothetical protein [Burkholderia sp. Tr-20390]|uniref:hypothetical protein n=1 Tax=Burkholderia sp. Tr-20390 TaxID=2703904 RepID=UPI001980ADF1|nr:hypothetical protein [Burkholderia sp. Tr-20390]MBN3734642.1 hypothetical protein [Burkholderia sp. Tr-20390]
MQNFTAVLDGTNPYVGSIRGLVLLIQTATQGNALTIQLLRAGAVVDTVTGMGPAAKLIPVGGFDSFTITGAAGTVQGVVTMGDIDIQLSQVGTNITNDATHPVPVSIVNEPGAPFQVSAPVGQEVNVKVQGTVNVSGATLTATNVGINNTSANPVPVSLISEPGAPIAVTPTQATSVTDAAPVAVAAFTSGSPNQVHIRAAGACRALRIANPIASTGKLYVGGSGVTPTNAAIVLQPGDMWNETDAPQIDWYATSDTGATANLQVIA